MISLHGMADKFLGLLSPASEAGREVANFIVGINTHPFIVFKICLSLIIGKNINKDYNSHLYSLGFQFLW